MRSPLSLLITVVGLGVVGGATLQTALAYTQFNPSTSMTTDAYNYLYNYDDYNPKTNPGDPACYRLQPGDPTGSLFNNATNGFAPNGTPELSAEYPWLSLAGAPTSNTVTKTSPTPTPVNLQINNITMNCELLTKMVYFPKDTQKPLTYPAGANEQTATTTKVVNLTTSDSGQGGNAVLTGGDISITAPVAGGSTKYWDSDGGASNTLPVTYNPPSTGFVNGTVIVSANVRQFNTFLTPSGHTEYACVVGGGLVGTVDGPPPNPDSCPEAPTPLQFTLNIHVPSDQATCAVSAPSTVRAGTSFVVNITMTNGTFGATTWSVPAYKIATTFNGVNVANTGTLTLPPPGVYPSDSGPASVVTTTQTITPPINPDGVGDTYTGTYQMEHGNNLFGASCSFSTIERRQFTYVPTIAISPANSSTILPASNAHVYPGETLNLTETVRNTTNNPTSAGDPYNWAVKGYAGAYSYSPPAASIAFPNPVFDFPMTTGGSGYDAAGVPANGTTTERAPTPISPYSGTYTVPATDPDGTQICFYSSVTPAQRNNYKNAAYSELWGYSNPATPAFPDYSGLPNANVRSNIGISNDSCVEVDQARNLGLQVTQGDVHAGGGVNTAAVGTSCSLGSGLPQGQTGALYAAVGGANGSYAQYVASAAGNISNNFSTGGNNGNPTLTLGNSAGTGYYGIVCRPDMAKAANAYYAAHGHTWAGTLNGGYVGPLPAAGGLYHVTGNVTITDSVVSSPITLFSDCENCNIIIAGNITYANAPSVSALPSFGVITSGSNIDFYGSHTNPAAQQDAGFYVSQLDSSNQGGAIYTCSDHTPGLTGDCPGPLQILGSLTANRFVFGRTGVATSLSGGIVTESITQSALLYLAPPPAFATQSGTPYSLPQYYGEEVPLY
jgi:hypothetical protein